MAVKSVLSGSSIHRKYAFYNENASRPNNSCGSWDITFSMHSCNPHITFKIPIVFFMYS